MSHSGMVQSAGSSGGPANNQGGRNTQPPSKYPPLPQGHQAQHVPPPSNHNVPPPHRANPQPPAPPQLRQAGPGGPYPYPPRGLAQPDMKSGPGHVANQGTHPHQAGVPIGPYGTLPALAVPQNLLQHNQPMIAQQRGFVMMRGQAAGYNTCSTIQSRLQNPPVNLPPNAGFVRQQIYPMGNSQPYPPNYFISQNAQMAQNMPSPTMINPNQPAQSLPPKRQSKAIPIVNPHTGEEVLATQRKSSSGPPPSATVMVLPPTMGGMSMPVAGAPIAGPPPTNPGFVPGSPGMPLHMPVMEQEQPPKAPAPAQEAVVVDVSTKRDNSASRHSPAPQMGPSLTTAAAASSLVGSSPPPVAPTKLSSASTPKTNAADPLLAEATKETPTKQSSARENVQQPNREPAQKASQSSSSTGRAKSPMTNPTTAKKAASPSLTSSTTSPSPVGSANEAATAGQSRVADKAQPLPDVIKTKSNQGRGDTESPRGARTSRGANVAPPPAAPAPQAAVEPPAPEAPVEPEEDVSPVVNVPVTAGKVESARSVPSAADEDEERRRVEERNEENLRKSQEATKHDSSQPAPVQENSAAPVAAVAAPDAAAAPAAATAQEEPKPQAESVKAPVEEVEKEVAEPSKETAPESPPASTVAAAREVKNVEPAGPSSPKAASDTALEEGEIVSDEGEADPVLTATGHMYKPGQWSPLCPDGKKQYDREFLLKLQSRPLSMNPPSEMPILDIFKETSHRHTLPPTPGLSHASASLDGYTQRNGQRPGVGAMHRNKQPQMRNSADRTMKKVITLSSSTNEEVKLHVAENAWKPVKEQNADSDAALYKRFRGILNKLTPQKFSALVDQVKQLEINTEDRLSNVTNLVLEKALNETHFASTYAKLCHTLLTEISIIKTDPNSLGPQTVNFRKMLLQKCQQEFERDTDDSDATKAREKIQEQERRKQLESCETDQQRKELQEGFDEQDVKAKRRTLGLMRFIGELYNLHILNFNIMHDCFLKLLKNPTDEDSIVCACKLFSTVGRRLSEDVKSCTKEPEKQKMKERYDELMQILKKIIHENREAQKSNSEHLPQRVIFMLEDVWELKTRSWVPRRDEQAPKTLDQIHKEAANEKIIAQGANQGSSGGGGGGGRYNSMPNDRNRRNYGNQSQGSGSGTNYKQTKDMLGQIPIKLLPLNASNPFGANRGGQNWVAGASGGGSRNSSLRGSSRLDNNDSSPNMNSINKFELLNTDASDHPVRSQESSPSRAHDRERVRDREAAIQGARTLSHYGNNRAPSGPRSSAPSSRTPSLSGPTAPGTTYSLLGKNEDDGDKVKRYAETIFAEFLVNANSNDFLHDFCERVHKDNLEQFIAHFINLAVNKPKNIGRLAEAIRELHKARILSVRNFENILKEQLEDSEDIVFDIPKFYEYMAELVSQLVDEMDPISLIRAICDTLKENSPKLLLPLLKFIKAAGANGIALKWKKSGISIPELVSGASDNDIKLLEEALADLGASSSGSATPDMTVAELTKKFKAAFDIKDDLERDKMLEEIIQKAGKDHRITALRACSTALLYLGLTEANKFAWPERFKEGLSYRIPAPVKGLFTEDISIHALYALQVVNNELHHPKDLTSNYLNFLYDSELVDDTTILTWGDNTRADIKHEQVGYHMTVTNAGPFLRFLQELVDSEQIN